MPGSIQQALPTGKLGFVVVGACAASLHYLLALLLHGLIGLPPGWANALAFACAFVLSYQGHRRLSFPDSCLPHRQALPRFAVVALTGFLSNQGVMLGLVHGLGWPFWLALGVALASVAKFTYLLGRHWAFR